MQAGSNEPDMGLITGLVMLCVRGVLLWLVIPLTVLAWILGLPFWRKQGATIEQLIGWADLNLIACLQRGPLRLSVRNPLHWTPVSEVSRVDHRVSFVDPA